MLKMAPRAVFSASPFEILPVPPARVSSSSKAIRNVALNRSLRVPPQRYMSSRSMRLSIPAGETANPCSTLKSYLTSVRVDSRVPRRLVQALDCC